LVDGKEESTVRNDKDKGRSRVDRADRKIIAMLEVNPRLTQSEIAKELGVSQSSIALRLYKLKKSSLLMEASGVNYETLGMQMCRVDVDTTNDKKVLNWAQKCPLFINASEGTGEDALSLYFSAEDNDSFHEIIDEHLRKIESVNGVHFAVIRSWYRPFMLQLNLDYTNREKPPCEMMPYCEKCPTNPKYNGRIWNHKRLRELIQNNH
jgi:DNA-binding Lrp family transcriptional regulator